MFTYKLNICAFISNENMFFIVILRVGLSNKYYKLSVCM